MQVERYFVCVYSKKNIIFIKAAKVGAVDKLIGITKTCVELYLYRFFYGGFINDGTK